MSYIFAFGHRIFTILVSSPHTWNYARAKLAEDLSQIVEGYIAFVKIKVWKPISYKVSPKMHCFKPYWAFPLNLNALITWNIIPNRIKIMDILQKPVDGRVLLAEELYRIPCLLPPFNVPVIIWIRDKNFEDLTIRSQKYCCYFF